MWANNIDTKIALVVSKIKVTILDRDNVIVDLKAAREANNPNKYKKMMSNVIWISFKSNNTIT